MTEKIKKKMLTVGMKILVGVAATLTICIGGILYTIWQANKKVDAYTQEVLQIREMDSKHLRETIVSLQATMLDFNKYLTVNSDGQVKEWLDSNYSSEETQVLQGRESWKKLFNRKERRDLTKQKTIVKETNGRFAVNFGLFNEQGDFLENVEQRVYSLPPGKNLEMIKTEISTFIENTSKENLLQNNLSKLSAAIADEAMQAEMTRTEILDFTEDIDQKETALHRVKEQNNRFVLIISGLICVVSLLVSFILIKIVVERPLTFLTTIIEALRRGESPDIPWKKRSDQIGVLAGAINNFKDALLEIRYEGERRQKEQVAINETVDYMQYTVNGLVEKAQVLNRMSADMVSLAGTTSSQSENVAKKAESGADLTRRAAESTDKLQELVEDIQAEVARQNGAVKDLGENTKRSRQVIDGLTDAAKEISSIITIVRDISDQTKLLALNATIEAARAGEAGHGFAVVAREVKELSLQTEEATTEIDLKTRTIAETCEQMSEIISQITKQTTSLHQTSEAIENAVAKQQDDTETIATLVRNTSKDTNEVSEKIQQVREEAEQTTDISGKVSESVEGITKQLTDLLTETTDRLRTVARA